MAAYLRIERRAVSGPTPAPLEAFTAGGPVAASPGFRVPAPDGLALMPFQVAGVEWAIQHPRCLIADEPGLGKTIQALGLLNAVPSIRRVLVVCPAGLKLNWAAEAERWMTHPRPVTVVRGAGWPEVDLEGHLVIINFELVAKHRPEIDRVSWDLVVVDEAHRLKSTQAKRKVWLLGGKIKATATRPGRFVRPVATARWLMLTGTPLVNRAYELWPLVRTLDPAGLGADWQGFVTRYCGGAKTPWGWSREGTTNPAELGHRLVQAGMIRRLKSQVLTELPPKGRQVLILPREVAAAAVAGEEKTQLRWADLLEPLEAAARRGDLLGYREALRRLQADAEASGYVFAARARLAQAKVRPVLEHLRSLLEEGEFKIVVFAHHRAMVTAIAAGLREFGAARIDGSMSLQARQVAVLTFQHDLECRVLVASITAAGEGLTMTAAALAVFAEYPWEPGSCEQCEDRLHRIGQTREVRVQYLAVEGSLDARMLVTVEAKRAGIRAAVG